MNSKLTPKERGLLKGAIRRVFSRSDLRKKVLDSSTVDHKDDNRPRVKKWSICFTCKKLVPKYKMVVDHILPVIRTDESFEELSLDLVIDRMWCSEDNLQPICPDCHDIKTKGERNERKRYKDSKGPTKTISKRRARKRTID